MTCRGRGLVPSSFALCVVLKQRKRRINVKPTFLQCSMLLVLLLLKESPSWRRACQELGPPEFLCKQKLLKVPELQTFYWKTRVSFLVVENTRYKIPPSFSFTCMLMEAVLIFSIPPNCSVPPQRDAASHCWCNRTVFFNLF